MKITFIGQRIQDLGGFEKNNPLQKSIEEVIRTNLLRHLAQNPKTIVVTGANLGIEMWAGSMAAQMDLPVHMYVPFDNPESKWFGSNKSTYLYLLKKASKVIQVGTGPFSSKAMLDKEIRMVDDSDIIYTFYTSGCGMLKYIERNNKKSIDLMPMGEDSDQYIVI